MHAASVGHSSSGRNSSKSCVCKADVSAPNADTKAEAIHICSTTGELELVWDKSDVVHMDDAMAVPATGGFYKSVAHHFYEVAAA